MRKVKGYKNCVSEDLSLTSLISSNALKHKKTVNYFTVSKNLNTNLECVACATGADPLLNIYTGEQLVMLNPAMMQKDGIEQFELLTVCQDIAVPDNGYYFEFLDAIAVRKTDGSTACIYPNDNVMEKSEFLTKCAKLMHDPRPQLPQWAVDELNNKSAATQEQARQNLGVEHILAALFVPTNVRGKNCLFFTIILALFFSITTIRWMVWCILLMVYTCTNLSSKSVRKREW